ncbi:tripartite tricarboxylate transporter permease [Desulfopila inferna]|uniref:tripartite tricarboxylate transporter permease n=1 Tax=Desulfopila inferna TaxID=468528 RepID=UPI0019663390|nr:tripartite tricarboxylate transporter permease [Desulfopila inferna]MBM9605775.1 tripartite tricarboxylate transporter permease [Desulfopila inferna]
MAFEYLPMYFDSWLILYLLVGYFIGFFFGAVPGLTSTLAISLLLPITFGMEVINALVTCVGIFVGGIYGGGVTGILINIPGAPAAAITVTEGYKLTQQGKAGRALSHGAFSSMVGGMVGALFTIFFIQYIADLSLHFKTPDKFSLILMAIVVSMLINSNDLGKGIISTLLGLMVAAIGIDTFEARPRMSFGIENIREGVQLLTVVVGTFAISEIFTQLATTPLRAKEVLSRLKLTKDSYNFKPKYKDIKEIGLWCYLRSSIIGFLTGILPGAGAAMASLISYAVAKAFSRKKDQYGKGSLEGISAAETANNAMCPGAIIPLLTFGIPGDAVTALILGVFTLHGLIPGPMLMVEQADTMGPMLLAFLITPALIFISLFIFGRYYIKIPLVNRQFLYPFIAFTAMVGLYAATYSIVQLVHAVIIGFVIFLLSARDYPAVPFLLGFILGPYFEKSFRTSMALSGGDVTIFFRSSFSLFFLILSVAMIYFLGIRLPETLKKK